MDNTAYFINGSLVDVHPRNSKNTLYEDRGIAYNARFIVSDGITYDLTKYSDIIKMAIPNFTDAYDTTSSLDYILRMCASNFRNQGQNRISVAVLAMATKMMIYSHIGWSSKDFKRIVYWLIEDGREKEAERFEHFIDTNEKVLNKTDLSRIQRKNFDQMIASNDYIAFESMSPVICEFCSKYSGHIFSVNIEKPLYPPLPPELYGHTQFHAKCNSILRPYFGERIYYKGQEYSAVERSYISFIDRARKSPHIIAICGLLHFVLSRRPRA